MKFEITPKEIQSFVTKNPSSKKMMDSLFPEWNYTPLDDKPFIEIGQIFLRRGVSDKNTYYLTIKNNILQVINTTNGYAWTSVGMEWYSDKKILTQGEFKKIMKQSKNPLIDFIPIPSDILILYRDSQAAVNHVTNLE